MTRQPLKLLAAALVAAGFTLAPALSQTARPDAADEGRNTPAAMPQLASLVPVNMVVGEVRTIPVRGVTRVALGNGKVVTSTVLENEVLLLAEAAGDTSLFLWQK